MIFKYIKEAHGSHRSPVKHFIIIKKLYILNQDMIIPARIVMCWPSWIEMLAQLFLSKQNKFYKWLLHVAVIFTWEKSVTLHLYKREDALIVECIVEINPIVLQKKIFKCCQRYFTTSIKVALGVSPQFFSIWIRVLNHILHHCKIQIKPTCTIKVLKLHLAYLPNFFPFEPEY